MGTPQYGVARTGRASVCSATAARRQGRRLRARVDGNQPEARAVEPEERELVVAMRELDRLLARHGHRDAVLAVLAVGRDADEMAVRQRARAQLHLKPGATARITPLA